MTQNQEKWAKARSRLAAAVTSLGYPEEFADLLAKQLRSPGAIDRMSAYLIQARPGNVETIVDEMLAICSDIDAWRDKKESLEANAKYNEILNNGL